jgi:uncharacterized Zn finger protein
MSWYYYNDYVPVAKRREQVLKKIEKLKKTGEEIHPIGPLAGRGLIAKSFWGKGWCKHLEKFSDYANRLPRGRSYVRNGAVYHLAIEPETVTALVSGSSPYELTIHIAPLAPEKWKTIKAGCKGKIGSLIELLQGKISDEIMARVTDKEAGLFPHPHEIRFNCNCPDWADMCKHVAAAMYGIGVRLDDEPELLFTLRGVNHEELITVDDAIENLTDGSRSRRRRTLQTEDISNVFGVDLDDETETPAPRPRSSRKKAKAKEFKPTGASIRALRKKTGLSRAAFARQVGVSAPTLARWEKTKGSLKLRADSLETLRRAHNDAHKT